VRRPAALLQAGPRRGEGDARGAGGRGAGGGV